MWFRCDTPVNNSGPYWKALWNAPASPALSLSWYPHPAVLWPHQQYCDVMSSIVMSPAVLKSIFCAINCLHRNRPYISVLLFDYVSNFIFYYWYLFNSIENGLNVKDEREEKKNYFPQGSETGYQMHVHRKGQNQSFLSRGSDYRMSL